MPDGTHPGPEYLRAEEWGAIRARRARRRFAAGAGVVLTVALAAVWWVRAPALRAVEELGNAARHLETVDQSVITASTIGSDDARTLVWKEWRVGERSLLRVARTGIVYVQRGYGGFTYDPVSATVRDDRFLRSEIDCRALVAELFERAATAPRLEQLPSRDVAGRRVRPFRFELGRERFTTSIDDATGHAAACLVELHTSTGWVPTHEFVLDLESGAFDATLEWTPPPGTTRVESVPEATSGGAGRASGVAAAAGAGGGPQVRGPQPAENPLEPSRVIATVPLGQRGAIRFGAVEMNAEGDLFVVVHSLGAAQPYVTDDLGTVYFRDNDVRTWPSIPATEYLFVPMERPDGAFKPRTVTIRFPEPRRTATAWPARDMATYEVAFPKPTCAAAPWYRHTEPGADYATLYEAETVRGRHFERMLRTPSGRQIDTLGGGGRVPGEEPPRTSVNPEDQFNSARSYRRALALYRESGAYSGPTPATVGYRLFELFRAFGDEGGAARALGSAEAALQKGTPEPDASDIRSNARFLRERPR